jgi:hypothetical protein
MFETSHQGLCSTDGEWAGFARDRTIIWVLSRVVGDALPASDILRDMRLHFFHHFLT